ncbi:MAG: MYG1 family protein [Chlamydiales bacterium]
MGDELKQQSGLQGAIFCHKGRFTSVWETKEDALAAVKEVFRKNGIELQDNI